MRSVEDSYQRLGLARIDILYVHDIGVYQHGEEENAKHFAVLAAMLVRVSPALMTYSCPGSRADSTFTCAKLAARIRK